MFSIIIPIYNVEQYLVKCLNSILNQQDGDWEAICVDDGSSDNSPHILDEYHTRDSRFHVIHQPNSGVSIARNRGLDLAKGEYILFIDPDDWIHPETLSILKNHHSKMPCDLIEFGRFLHNEHSISESLPSHIFKSDTPAVFPVNYQTVINRTTSVWDKLFLQKIIQEHHIRFSPGILIGEDLRFIMEYIQYCHHLSILPQALYHYRRWTGITALNGLKRAHHTAADYLSSFDALVPLAPNYARYASPHIKKELRSALLYKSLAARIYIGRLQNHCLNELLRLSSFSVWPILKGSHLKYSIQALLSMPPSPFWKKLSMLYYHLKKLKKICQ